jgi:hypothetical protein
MYKATIIKVQILIEIIDFIEADICGWCTRVTCIPQWKGIKLSEAWSVALYERHSDEGLRVT